MNSSGAGGGTASGSPTGRAGGVWFEDFAVGQRFHGAEREVTERHPDLAVFVDLLPQLGVVDDPVVALVDTHWRSLLPVQVGDTLRFETTVTRCRRSRDGRQGTVNRAVVLRNQHGQRVQQGTLAVIVRARDSRAEDPVGRAFGTVAWGEALARRLAGDERFSAATGSWDGTIGLRCGAEEVQLRIYRGRVLEATRRAPHGATFTVEAEELSWTELLTGARNDFTRRAMNGEFEARGSGYEYLRLTRAVMVLVDRARELAAEGDR